MAADVNPSVNNWHSLTPYHDDPSIPSYSNFETDDESVPDIKHLFISADCPTLINNVSNRPEVGNSTNNLFKKDLDYPGYYTYVGRRDDILNIQNGEKKIRFRWYQQLKIIPYT